MEKPKYPSDEAAKFMLRLPGDMRDRIADAAQKNGRSMNAEIVHRLQQSFAAAPAPAEGQWTKAFPHAAKAAASGSDFEYLEARQRAVFRSLKLQQLTTRADALQNQIFTLENQALTLQDSLLRKMSEADQPGITKLRAKQISQEIRLLKDRLTEVDERVKRLRIAGDAVAHELRDADFSITQAAILSARPDGWIEVVGDAHFIEAELAAAGIEWERRDNVLLVHPDYAPKVRAIFQAFPREVLAELRRRAESERQE